MNEDEQPLTEREQQELLGDLKEWLVVHRAVRKIAAMTEEEWSALEAETAGWKFY